MEEVMSGQAGRSRNSHRKNSTMLPGRSGPGHAATARRRTTFTGSAQTSGRKSRSRGRREPRGSPQLTSSSRSSRWERAGVVTRQLPLFYPSPTPYGPAAAGGATTLASSSATPSTATAAACGEPGPRGSQSRGAQMAETSDSVGGTGEKVRHSTRQVR